MPDPQTRPHRRFNPLLDEWVLVSPQRLSRPWLGRSEPAAGAARRPATIRSAISVRETARAGDVRNPSTSDTFVFDNDFPALLTREPRTRSPPRTQSTTLLLAVPETRHLPRRLLLSAPRRVAPVAVDTPSCGASWTSGSSNCATLGARSRTSSYVQIFENRGAAMGASNPHPHGQIWASATVPDVPAREQASVRSAIARRAAACLLCDYLARRAAGRRSRVVCDNDVVRRRSYRSGRSGRSRRWCLPRAMLAGARRTDDGENGRRSPTS